MRKFFIGFAIVLGLLIILNFLLEPVALRVVNKELSKLEGYKGSVEDIDIALWRGAYAIEGMRIEKIGSKAPEPFFYADVIDISLQWSALFQGAIEGEVILENPLLNFAVQPSTGEVQTGGDNDWTQTIKNLVPITINRFELVNARVFYKDPTATPKVELELSSFDLVALNLHNASGQENLLPSTLKANGNMSGNGKLNIDAQLNVLKKTPDFDLTLTLNELELNSLKDFTDAYAGFTFKEGTLFVSSEIAMKDGKYEGYVKPILDDIKVIDVDDENSSFWRKAWEVVIGAVLEVFQNQRTGEFATKVPFSGDVNTSDVGVIQTLANVLQNAFISSFSKNVEGSINIEDASNQKEDKNFFEELFDDDGKKEEDK